MKIPIFFILLVAFTNSAIFTISSIQCTSRYEDSFYKIFAWCMVKYEWKYITEELYKKAFEQNINLNK